MSGPDDSGISTNDIVNHWTPPGEAKPLSERVLDALEATGLDLEQLTLEDLAPVDEFHIGGREATESFLDQLELDADDHVLDVGCGLGGASRFAAQRYGCRVTGIHRAAGT